MLYGGGSTGGQNDLYKTAVIDTIVAEIQSVPGEDRCILLLGYKDQMVEMFQVIRCLFFLVQKLMMINKERQSWFVSEVCHRKCIPFQGFQ